MDESIKKGTVVTIVVIILVIVLGGWVWSKYVSKTNQTLKEETQTQIENQSPVMRITAKHQFKNAKHIIAGEVDLPTACYVLDAKASVAGSASEQVTIAFTAQTQGDLCAQVITAERFKIDFGASKDAVLKATWNGKPAILNLIPAGAGEDLNNFELFIKG